MRPKIPELRKALVGRFDDHHALLARMHLDHIDHLAEMVARLDDEVDRLMAPFAEHARRLMSVPGVGKRTVEVVVSEAGVDMSRFPTAAHLASWAGLCPGNNEPAGKKKSGRARKGDEALRTALCEAAWAAAHGKSTYCRPSTGASCAASAPKARAKPSSPSPTPSSSSSGTC
jgi:transposase